MEKVAFRRIGFGVLIVGGLFAGWNLLATWLGTVRPDALVFNEYIMVLIDCALYGLSILALWALLRELPGPQPARIPRERMHVGKFLGYFCVARGTAVVLSIVGTILYVVLALLMKGPDGLMQYFQDANPLLGSGNAMQSWLLMLVVCVVAPVAEEWMFRRLLLDALRPFGDTVAILYSGIAFGLLHMNVQQIVYATGFGLLLGYVMVRTDNIWICMGLHAAVNTSSMIVLPVLESRLQSYVVMMALVAFVCALMAACAIGLVLFFVYVKRVRLLPPAYRFSEPIKAKMVLLNPGTICYMVLCAGVSLFLIAWA
jgi:membrane protease YdiL (CAAX protease family)